MRYYEDVENGVTIRKSNDEIIADFYVKVAKVSKYLENEKIVKTTYHLQFYNPYCIGTAEVDVQDLEKFNYSIVSDKLLLSPTASTAGKELAYYIRSQGNKLTPDIVYLFNRLGWHKIGGSHVYCAGDTIIGSCPENYVVAEALRSKYKYEYYDSVSELDCLEGIFQLLKVDKYICPIVFTTGMIGVLRQLFKEANIKVPCCLYLFGPSQTRKTTISIFCTALYGRSDFHSLSGISTLRVSSTEFKTEECADSLKDATFVFDDLYKEQDRRLRKEYEKRIRNIIRNFADNSPRTTARSSFESNSQVIITAEYLLKSKTDVGRLFILEVTEPINSEKLSLCQDKPLMVSTFYRYFIQWVSKNYDAIVQDIKEQFVAFRRYSNSHAFGYERLYEQSFLLNYAYNLLLRYAMEVGVTIRDKQAVEDEFSSIVNEALRKQKTIIQSLEANEINAVNFSSVLIDSLQNKEIVVGKKGEDCFVKNNRLYITNHVLGKHLREKLGKSISAKSVSAYFRERYISEVYSDNRSKRYNNKRYLVLNINELVKDAKDCSGDIENFFFE